MAIINSSVCDHCKKQRQIDSSVMDYDITINIDSNNDVRWSEGKYTYLHNLCPECFNIIMKHLEVYFEDMEAWPW